MNPFQQSTTTAPAQSAPVAPAGPGAPTHQTSPFGAPAGAGAPYVPAPGDDPFGGPAAQSSRPRIRDCEGRLLLLMPRKIEYGVVSKNLRNPDGSPVVQDRMTVDYVVLDGGPLHYGGTPDARQASQRKPHDKVHEVPWFIRGAYVSGKGLVSQLEDALDAATRLARGQRPREGTHPMALGRLYQGEPTANPEGAWLISEPTDEDKLHARAWLAANPRDSFA